jgi:hypothetical protein
MKRIIELLKKDKEEINEMLDEATEEKHKKCVKPNGGFDYDKMFEMRHKGEW